MPCKGFFYIFDVALRKESVDRNDKSKKSKMEKRKSLSARRAWIEIAGFIGGLKAIIVALRKESVDRNFVVLSIQMFLEGRSPQGERG